MKNEIEQRFFLTGEDVTRHVLHLLIFQRRENTLTCTALTEDPLRLMCIRNRRKLEELLCLCNPRETGVICLMMNNRCKQLRK